MKGFTRPQTHARSKSSPQRWKSLKPLPVDVNVPMTPLYAMM
jgi:hypothetical protein